jgi:hypothetical protein
MKSSSEKGRWKMTKSVFVTIYKSIVILSPFGLLLSIAFFMIQAKESEQLVGNLTHIEQSLSTRHIGIFPDYLDKINQLLYETPRMQDDTTKIIIFEDVLFYGAFYNGTAFKEMMRQLSELSEKGKKIVIAYYDNNEDMRKGKMFREVVQESWMRQQDLSALSQERRAWMDKLRKEKASGGGGAVFRIADSIASEKYFACYRENELKEFSERIEKIRSPLYDKAKNDDLLFQKLDNIKNTCLNKPVKTITFYDIYTLYHQVTEELKAFFGQHNIQLLPLDNYLTMSCWSNGEKVLFAFPGRFAAEEIGFISSDIAILYYINTMLEGVENSLKNNAMLE